MTSARLQRAVMRLLRNRLNARVASSPSGHRLGVAGWSAPPPVPASGYSPSLTAPAQDPTLAGTDVPGAAPRPRMVAVSSRESRTLRHGCARGCNARALLPRSKPTCAAEQRRSAAPGHLSFSSRSKPLPAVSRPLPARDEAIRL